LADRFGLDPRRIAVQYPGFAAARFNVRRAAELRERARAALGVDASVPLIGLVTSGDFEKRGLDLFLETAASIARSAPAARYLVVGSKRLPDAARAHPLVVAGRVSYRPKNADPELWLAALDLLVYPARFEEFGMIVIEALASGVPVLTSRRVGASECLPRAYMPWLLDAPEPGRFAELALQLLGDPRARAELAAIGAAAVAAFDERAYARATIELLKPVR
jgi:glycosyltransferase involved in cell wall biosynthesis